MVKVFTLNKENKIELTKEELEKLLNESYWDGYRVGQQQTSWIYHSPLRWNDQWYYNTCSNTTSSIKIETEDGN